MLLQLHGSGILQVSAVRVVLCCSEDGVTRDVVVGVIVVVWVFEITVSEQQRTDGVADALDVHVGRIDFMRELPAVDIRPWSPEGRLHSSAAHTRLVSP